MEFDDVINERRAVNFFNKTKDVSEDLLKQAVEMAAKTPSSFNLQPWSLIILRKLEDKERLKKLAMGQPKVVEAPVTLIVLADRQGWSEENKFANKNFEEMIKAGSITEKKKDWYD